MARPPLLTDDQLKKIQDEAYEGMLSKHWLIDHFNVSEKTAERTMKKLGLIQTSPQYIEMIRRYLEGENYTTLCMEYSMSQPNFHSILRHRKIETRGTMYFANFRYFDEIDTEAKAYFLGFIYADGNLSRNTLKISIHDRDRDVLYKLQAEMSSDHPVVLEDVLTPSGLMPSARIEISHKYIADAMKKYGVVPAKTHLLDSVPQLENDLMRHFIRGYFDGDGSFSSYVLSKGKREGDTKMSLSIVGTAPFLESLRESINGLSPIQMEAELYDRWPERGTNTRQLCTSGIPQVMSFLKWLYSDCDFYLDRKYNKFKELE